MPMWDALAGINRFPISFHSPLLGVGTHIIATTRTREEANREQRRFSAFRMSVAKSVPNSHECLISGLSIFRTRTSIVKESDSVWVVLVTTTPALDIAAILAEALN